jgi:hypothetical protein
VHAEGTRVACHDHDKSAGGCPTAAAAAAAVVTAPLVGPSEVTEPNPVDVKEYIHLVALAMRAWAAHVEQSVVTCC